MGVYRSLSTLPRRFYRGRSGESKRPGGSSPLWQPVRFGGAPEGEVSGDARHRAVLVLLMAGAAVLRLYRLDAAPLGFHPTRQYRSLIIARGFYLDGLASVPEWRGRVAALNLERQGLLEPPIGELLTAIGYRFLGGESYWLPRSLSVVFWVAGAYFLYRIGFRLIGATGGVIAAALYLFFPFAVIASRSFQPDPLMIMLTLAAVLAVLRYHDRPSGRRLVGAVAVSAGAIFVKPPAVFLLYAVFVLLLVERKGWVRSLSHSSLWIYGVGGALPAIAYYLVYGLYLTGQLEAQAEASFLPLFVLEPLFWRSWAANLSVVIGWPVLILALLGAFLFPRGRPRAAVLGLWGGYVLFCLVFSYHIASHDYYHLQLIPVVALSVAAVFASIWDRLMEMNRGLLARGALGAILAIGFAWNGLVVRDELLRDVAARHQVERAEQAGELVHHGVRNLVLASDYGLTLQYHGEVSSRPWPLVSDLEWERLAGREILSPEARMEQWFGDEDVDYFIVMDLWELEQQGDLEAFLAEEAERVTRTDGLAIFDLRGDAG